MSQHIRILTGAILLATWSYLNVVRAEDSSATDSSQDSLLLENKIHSRHHGKLSRALTAAGMAKIVENQGNYTLFAPTDEAFAEHNNDNVGGMMKSGDQAKLGKLMNCHMISGKHTTGELMQKVRNGNGGFDETTLGGCKLSFSVVKAKIVVKDEQGGTATITDSDETQSNAMIQTINHVLVPKN